MESGHHRSDRDCQGLRRLLVRQVLDVAQQDDLLEDGWQLPDTLQDEFVGQFLRYRWDKRHGLRDAVVGIVHQNRSALRSTPIADDAMQARDEPGPTVRAGLIA